MLCTLSLWACAYMLGRAYTCLIFSVGSVDTFTLFSHMYAFQNLCICIMATPCPLQGLLSYFFSVYTSLTCAPCRASRMKLVCLAAVPISSELHLALRPQDTHGPCLFRICVEHYVLSTKLQSCQYL